MSSQVAAYHEKVYSDGFFHVSGDHGFLPVRDPISKLPERYAALQAIMDEMPTNKVYPDVPGILAKPNAIEQYVNDLPDYSEVVRGETDVFIIQALYRAYTFLASAYTLELSYQQFVIDGNYGKARTSLPANVAKALVIVSEKLDVYPFLDYHYSYSLGNYVKVDPSGSLHWKNLGMACKFSGTPDEIGFIMLHVYINEVSPALVDGIMQVGKGVDISANLKRTVLTMKEVNSRRKEMWTASRHERYNDFRIFIMGIKGNEALYGDGLVYEGCFNNEPQQYRGQTGAQDSLIPMMDIFSGIVDHYPENKLTEYLLDLRTYRPKCIQEFFVDLREHYAKKPLFQTLSEAGKFEELIYLLAIVNEVYLFRNGHWQFVQKYIMANTKYPKATGGTPITSWLINQIEAVLHYESVIIDVLQKNEAAFLSALPADAAGWYQDLATGYPLKRRLLEEQVALLQSNDIDVALVYKANQTYQLKDSEETM
jgi:indoleamine 2,3-dioxygenase